jgi:hypothetical protein
MRRRERDNSAASGMSTARTTMPLARWRRPTPTPGGAMAEVLKKVEKNIFCLFDESPWRRLGDALLLDACRDCCEATFSIIAEHRKIWKFNLNLCVVIFIDILFYFTIL